MMFQISIYNMLDKVGQTYQLESRWIELHVPPPLKKSNPGSISSSNQHQINCIKCESQKDLTGQKKEEMGGDADSIERRRCRSNGGDADRTKAIVHYKKYEYQQQFAIARFHKLLPKVLKSDHNSIVALKSRQ